MEKKYKLRYLPLFVSDMEDCMDYILLRLQNFDAASQFLEQVEHAINRRLENPESYEPFKRNRIGAEGYSYYRIYVGNYTIYYVVIDDVMEVRRILSNRRNTTWIIEKEH